jgi:hypothetical protein
MSCDLFDVHADEYFSEEDNHEHQQIFEMPEENKKDDEEMMDMCPQDNQDNNDDQLFAEIEIDKYLEIDSDDEKDPVEMPMAIRRERVKKRYNLI